MATKLAANEITAILERELQGYQADVDVAEVGTVLSVGDGIARVYGLEKAMAGELLALPRRRRRPGAQPRGGQRRRRAPRRVRARSRRATRCERTGRIIAGAGGRGAGRPRGQRARRADRRQGPDRRRPSTTRIERKAPGIIDRQPVNEPLQTGIKAIDAMIPIGRGQRELIIGDRQTGKTAVAIDTIINQKGTGRDLHLRRRSARSSRPSPQVVEEARGARRDGVHHRRRRHRLRVGAAAVPRALRRLHDGRVLPRQRPPRADHLRRPLQAGGRLPPAVAAAAPPARPRGLPRRRLLPALPPARARRQAVRRAAAAAR